MGIYYLFSGFDEERGFSKELSFALKEDIKGTRLLLFIASSPVNTEKTDQYKRINDKYFKGIGLVFYEVAVIDYRVSPIEAKELIERASCIVLMGGNPIIQFQFIQEYQLVESLKQSDAVVCGISAGAINMGIHSFISKDEEFDETVIYNGLGLVDITVDPHFTLKKEKQIIQELRTIAYQPAIYGLCDEAAVRIKNLSTYFIGEVYKIQNGRIVNQN